jgi:lambda family phage minor tail protein L
MAIPVSELQKIAPSSIIELFELQLVTALHGSNTVYRFHAGSNMDANGELVWNANTYQRFPVEAEGFEYTGTGSLPRPKIRVSNVLGTITSILLTVNSTTAHNDLTGATLTRIRTMARYIDGANFTGGTNPYGTPDPTAEFPREIYKVARKSTENRQVVEFELAAAFDLAGVRAPKRQCIANICQWVYRSTECGYTGTNYFDANDVSVASSASDVCGKRLSSCKLRFGATAELPYGSFPGIGAYTV